MVDARGNVYATGRFHSTDCPVTGNAYRRSKNRDDPQDAVLVIFSRDGRRLLYGSYIGGSRVDRGRHIGIQPDGSNVYVIGESKSTDIPLLNPVQTTPSGAFLFKFAMSPRDQERGEAVGGDNR